MAEKPLATLAIKELFVTREPANSQELVVKRGLPVGGKAVATMRLRPG